ncbi:hypothetical protein [Jejuia pallidilutea]|uniref:Uncharacterized protein n=1 Tax=Jejuia pallidilutea TaxID=504487 RepID=A0A090WCF6_9FLAO|nr:hypothetical protein [Jejuia pallidilutea]GAL67151.1 hypothetical protein JCM19301_2316 [Jejuia pallidilutea]GAL73109.1 hypothetical protein JCM19302_1223 [Jejuia pallidilutea]GAL90705.1 hypothetical protein JCM19538_470 [Jejuia pallidilutea]
MKSIIKTPKHLKGITEENLFANKRILSFPSHQTFWTRLHHNMR